MTAIGAARLSIGFVAFALALAAHAQSAPAPTMKVGDRWVYNVKSGIGLQTITFQETREVTAVGSGGAFTLKVTGKDANGADFSVVEQFSGPYVLRSGTLCLNEMRQYPTPLASGQRSSKWADVVRPDGGKGQINYYFRTAAWEKVTVGAGDFDSIRVDTMMTLDDSTAFRSGTNCNNSYWYSPAVRGTVRERRYGQYTEFDLNHAPVAVLNAAYELASFTPGK
jgi:hypothetical protein